MAPSTRGYLGLPRATQGYPGQLGLLGVARGPRVQADRHACSAPRLADIGSDELAHTQ